jgi:hypothetical protein
VTGVARTGFRPGAVYADHCRQLDMIRRAVAAAGAELATSTTEVDRADGPRELRPGTLPGLVRGYGEQADGERPGTTAGLRMHRYIQACTGFYQVAGFKRAVMFSSDILRCTCLRTVQSGCPRYVDRLADALHRQEVS